MNYLQHKSILCRGKADLTENVSNVRETSYTQCVLVAEHYIKNCIPSGKKKSIIIHKVKCLQEKLNEPL